MPLGVSVQQKQGPQNSVPFQWPLGSGETGQAGEAGGDETRGTRETPRAPGLSHHPS